MIDEKRAFRAWPASCATRFIEDWVFGISG